MYVHNNEFQFTCASSSRQSFNIAILFFGITRKCTGAWGETSLKAIQTSSSYIISAGMSLDIILSNIVNAVLSAERALATSSEFQRFWIWWMLKFGVEIDFFLLPFPPKPATWNIGKCYYVINNNCEYCNNNDNNNSVNVCWSSDVF